MSFHTYVYKKGKNSCYYHFLVFPDGDLKGLLKQNNIKNDFSFLYKLINTNELCNELIEMLKIIDNNLNTKMISGVYSSETYRAW